MNSSFWIKKLPLSQLLLVICCCCFANDNVLQQARNFQKEGKYDQAISAYRAFISEPNGEEDIEDKEVASYTDALVQLMNSYQSKGEPEACIYALQNLYTESPLLQTIFLRDYNSVMGYALSRTEKMEEAQEATLKVFTLPLYHATPERYFRDYAYAAAVFYSNPDYQKEVITWCEKALEQAELCRNASGKQWVTAMLGSVYKRNGRLNKAIELFQESKEEAQSRNDDLGVLNSLHAMIDLFLYWDVPEYADIYASEAIRVEKNMKTKNPMVSAQTYINKGRALQQLEKTDSLPYYINRAMELCEGLPYNSGMVDVDLMHGIYLTRKGGDQEHLGIEKLLNVTRQGTAANRAKAYHQLAQTYLQDGQSEMAELMLDSMYSLLTQGESPVYIHIDYEPILSHYLERNNRCKAEQYTMMMIQEHQALTEKRLNYNLVEAIVTHQTQQKRQELEILKLRQANQRLWFIILAVLSLLMASAAVAFILYQKKRHRIRMRQADAKLASLVQKLNQSNAEKDIIRQEIGEIMNDKDSRQEMESLTPSVLQKNGETKFRQRFELLYPLFLPRLREKVPSVTRREELLAMLIVLKQDNKEIAELLAIAPRSVLMLRHRFRAKIGMTTENSLEDFISGLLEAPDDKM